MTRAYLFELINDITPHTGYIDLVEELEWHYIETSYGSAMTEIGKHGFRDPEGGECDLQEGLRNYRIDEVAELTCKLLDWMKRWVEADIKYFMKQPGFVEK